jgi:hypothetical protein
LKCCKGRKRRILYKSFSEKIDPKFIKTS